MPAFEVDVEDITGAGDTCTTGLIHIWLRDDQSPREAIRLAAAAAALSCTVVGPRGLLPNDSDVLAFLDDQ